MVVAQKTSFILLSILMLILPVGAHQNEKSSVNITINAIGGLKYDKVRFRVKPGENVKIVFENKDDMLHNLVFTVPDAREEVANAAIGPLCPAVK